GNPIRKEIRAALSAGRVAADGPPRLFVFGGSQGAAAVNRLVVEAIAILASRGTPLTVMHQTGPTSYQETVAAYQRIGFAADCREFITDMAAEYRRADLVISRAGATSVAELAIVGVPA